MFPRPRTCPTHRWGADREPLTVPRSRWPDDPAWKQHIARTWDPVYGDRRQEIVFIGTGMDETAIRRQLDRCLVDDADGMPVEAWRRLPDPFPVWKRAEPHE